MNRLFASLALIGLLLGGIQHRVIAQHIIISGVPADLGQKRQYAPLFSLLKTNGIDAFMPTFQYQEAPEAKSLGFEIDFLPPCSGSRHAFTALATTGTKLLMPAELLYPPGQTLPSLEKDPLKALLACLGRDALYGISNYDEAILNAIDSTALKAVYQRVKAIDNSIPVLMVHAPMLSDRALFNSTERQQRYLQNVIRYSRHADIVGFDVYPVPLALSKLIPATPVPELTDISVIESYLLWLKENLTDKKTLIVLQGFSYADLYEPDYLRRQLPPSIIDQLIAPSQSHIRQWLKLSERYKLHTVIWWGQALLANQQQAPWLDILTLSNKQHRQNWTPQGGISPLQLSSE